MNNIEEKEEWFSPSELDEITITLTKEQFTWLHSMLSNPILSNNKGILDILNTRLK